MTRGTTRIALVFLTLGHLLSALPFSLTFVVFLPFRLLGFLLNLVGFRLVLGSRTDDIPKYRWRAIIAPLLYLASLVTWPIIIALFVVFVLTGGSVLWKVLFFIFLGLAGFLYTASRSMFQAPLRRGLGKVTLVLVVVISLLLTVVVPPLSLIGSAYAEGKAHEAISDIGPKIWEWTEPYDEPNMTANGTVSGDGNVTLDDGNITQYLKAKLLNPVFERIRNNTNETVERAADAGDAIVSFGIPLIVADIAFSLATLLWLMVVSGSIITLGRQEKRWDEQMSPQQPYVINQDAGPD